MPTEAWFSHLAFLGPIPSPLTFSCLSICYLAKAHSPLLSGSCMRGFSTVWPSLAFLLAPLFPTPTSSPHFIGSSPLTVLTSWTCPLAEPARQSCSVRTLVLSHTTQTAKIDSFLLCVWNYYNILHHYTSLGNQCQKSSVPQAQYNLFNA